MKHTKKKTLRQMYNEHPEASAFLREHPEFNDRFLEEELHGPTHDINKGRYTLHDVADDSKEKGALMLEAASLLPDSSPYKRLLEAYYEGATLKTLQFAFGLPSQNALWQRLSRAKKAALKNMLKAQRVIIRNQTPLEAKTFSYKGQTKFVFLVVDDQTREHVWVRENGEVLPEDVQEILDNEEYEDVFL